MLIIFSRHLVESLPMLRLGHRGVNHESTTLTLNFRAAILAIWQKKSNGFPLGSLLAL